MTELEKQELEALKRLMEHDGWLVLMRDMTQQVEVIERHALDTVKTIEDLAYKKGVRDALRTLLNMEAFLESEQESDDASDDV